MKRFKGSKLLVPVSLLAAVAIGVTCATVLHSLTMENPINTPTVSGRVDETSSKKVTFTNTGEADIFLRASFSETWLYTEDRGETYIVLPNDSEIASPDINPNGTWTYNEDDGWYYYNYVLEGSSNGNGQESDPLIGGVTFDLSQADDARYQANGTDVYSDYQISVVMEVVQASDEWQVSVDAVKALFDKELSSATPSDWSNKYGCVISWPNS